MPDFDRKTPGLVPTSVCQDTKLAKTRPRRVLYEVADFRYAIRSARSLFFLMPAKIILVPGMYFLGFSK